MEDSLYTADLLMQKDRQEKLKWNTKVLDSVIDTIYTLGSQNMPLKGHRDDGKYYDNKGNNPGNFQVKLHHFLMGLLNSSLLQHSLSQSTF